MARFTDMLRNNPQQQVAPAGRFSKMLRSGGVNNPQAAPTQKTTGRLAPPQDEYRVTDDMGTGERVLAGLGRGLTVAGRGVKQLGLEAARALGAESVGGADINELLQELQGREADEKRLFDADLGKTGAGMAGAVIGESLPLLAVPGGAVARGASFAQKAAAGAGLGGAVGATQFVDEDETRLGNTLQGAALGGLAAGALEGVARGGSRAINAARGRLRPEVEDVTKLGQQHNVPVFAPDVAGSPMMGKIATLSEDVPLVGMAKPRLQQSEAAGKSAEALIGRLAPQIDDVGREIQGSLTRRTEALQKAAGVRYDRASKAADPLGEVPMNNLRSAADRLLDQAKQDVVPDQALINRLEKITKAANAPSFSVARQYRSGLGDEIRKLESAMDMKGARPLQQIKSALEKDLGQFADNAGGEVAKRWKSADRFFRERVIPQRERDIVRAARNNSPDEVFRQFVKASTKDRAQRLYSAMDKKGRNAVKAGILDQAWTKAVQDGSKGVTFSPAKFAQELERVQGAAGVFFKGADKKELDGFVKLMRHVERSGQVAENPPTGARLVLPVVMGEFLAPGTAVGAGTVGALSRALFTTEVGKRLLLASNRLPPGSPKLERFVSEFRRAVPAMIGTQESLPKQ